jgi:hypothetical protein
MEARVYYFRQKLIFPTIAVTKAGYFLEVEPVETLALSEATPSRIAAVLDRLRARGNPVVPTPSPPDFPRPVVLDPAGVRSWRTFEKGARTWAIRWGDNGLMLVPHRRRPDRGWQEDLDRVEVFQGEGAEIALAERLPEHIETNEES